VDLQRVGRAVAALKRQGPNADALESVMRKLHFMADEEDGTRNTCARLPTAPMSPHGSKCVELPCGSWCV